MDAQALISGSKVWLFSAVLLLLGACGGSQVKDDQVARLPVEDRQAFMDEERAVSSAKAELDASRVASEEAKTFRSIVGQELDGAKSQHEAAKKAIELAGQGPEQQPEPAARERAQVEREHLNAAEAKAAYADHLVELREAQEKMREAEVDVARTRLEREEFNALRARGMGEELNENDFAKAEREAQDAYDEARMQVSQAEGQAEHARQMWNDARQQYEASARRTGVSEVPSGAPAPHDTAAAKEMPEKQQQQIREQEQRQQPTDR
jgi:hypothetical protein